jgi:hypothetical protein
MSHRFRDRRRLGPGSGRVVEIDHVYHLRKDEREEFGPPLPSIATQSSCRIPQLKERKNQGKT